MAAREDSRRPDARESARKSEKSIERVRRFSLCVLLCALIVIDKGFLFVDALEHRRHGEFA